MSAPVRTLRIVQPPFDLLGDDPVVVVPVHSAGRPGGGTDALGLGGPDGVVSPVMTSR
ncbi:hypothetical protein [Micromonospora deserti]|uniref:hypothetical protein n=1 Tax=Micromonospora deserti TaxID=2070366 RepID=UPI001314CEF4|nr:hypothetical protein [Micromonospora deserti]